MGVISGGEKDTIPPALIKTTPPVNSLNINETEFSFVFDEVINTENIKEKLIVSPYISSSFEISTKKNYLLISFDSVFEKNTTYILNFADGIKDITEGNAAKSVKYVFSTGPVLDSMTIKGRVLDMLTNEPEKEVLVALYDKKDSLGLFVNKPLYFTYTNGLGEFYIENIKEDYYRLYAFLDKNLSFIAEHTKEDYGFVSDSVLVNLETDSVFIPLFKLNLTPLRLIRSRKRGLYYEATYSRYVTKIELLNKTEKTPNYSLNDNNLTLRFYPTSLLTTKDSLLVVVKAYDSLSAYTQDSMYVSFSDSKRSKEKFKVFGLPSNNTGLADTVLFNFSFNKPVLLFEKKHLFTVIDSLYKKELNIKDFIWNNNKTKLSFNYLYKKDPFKLWKENKISALKQDSSLYYSDSLYSVHYNYLERLNVNKITFLLEKGSFVSIEKDTLEKSSVVFSFKNSDYYGTVQGSIKTDYKSFFVELVSENFRTVYKNKSKKKDFFLFSNISPGTYYIRVFIDENENGVWDIGNIITNSQPEKIYFLEKPLEVRSNWEIDGILLSF